MMHWYLIRCYFEGFGLNMVTVKLLITNNIEQTYWKTYHRNRESAIIRLAWTCVITITTSNLRTHSENITYNKISTYIGNIWWQQAMHTHRLANDHSNREIVIINMLCACVHFIDVPICHFNATNNQQN